MNLWDRILTHLQAKINRQSFNTWLKPTQQLAFADRTLHVEVPSLLFADWISRNYMPLIHESAREIEAGELRLQFTSRQPGAVAGPRGAHASFPGGARVAEPRPEFGGRRAALAHTDRAPGPVVAPRAPPAPQRPAP